MASIFDALVNKGLFLQKYLLNHKEIVELIQLLVLDLISIYACERAKIVILIGYLDFFPFSHHKDG